MKIAILQTDSIPKVRQDTAGGDYPDLFKKLFLGIQRDIKLTTYDVINDKYPECIDIYDGFLITGSIESVYSNKLWVKRLEKYISNIIKIHQKKIIGICFGHQLIAQALGAKVVKMQKNVGLGSRSVNIVNVKPWMTPFKKNLSVQFSHYDHVIDLPKECEVIADSDYTPVQIFQYRDLALGFQAHPEMCKRHSHRLLYENRNKFQCCIDQALERLKQEDNSAFLAHWMVNFLQYKNKE